MELEELVKKKFTNEDMEELGTILLERSTFYTEKIVEYKVLKLKIDDEDIANSMQLNIDYYFKIKNVLDKFYDLLKEMRLEK